MLAMLLLKPQNYFNAVTAPSLKVQEHTITQLKVISEPTQQVKKKNKEQYMPSHG
jgi:hypothetical protein